MAYLTRLRGTNARLEDAVDLTGDISIIDTKNKNVLKWPLISTVYLYLCLILSFLTRCLKGPRVEGGGGQKTSSST